MNGDIDIDKIPARNFSAFEKTDDKMLNIFLFDVDRHFKNIENDYEKYLSEDEMAHAERFFQPEDKRRYLAGKYLIRYILSKSLDVSPASIRFTRAKYNKPESDGIKFNIAHSGNFVAIITGSENVGVDVEEIKPDFDFMELLPSIFTNREINFILADEKKAGKHFYRLWCRKEALLKATGEGLIDNLTEVDILDTHVHRENSVYRLFSFTLSENYALSIAVKQEDEIKFWKF